MKLIDDPAYFPTQIKWFNTQISTIDSDVWADRLSSINVIDGIVTKSANYFNEAELKALRELLNETGLKKLNNAISAYKRRQRGKVVPVQISLQPSTHRKLTKLREAKSQTASQYIEELIKNKRY